MGALARREHSRAELEKKMAAKGYEPEVSMAVLDKLAAAGLQDDRRFAEAYVRYRTGRGYGPRRIAEELRQRGINDGLGENALAEAEQDWFECAVKVYKKKFRSRPADFAERAKQMRFMQYRGFGHEHISYVLENHSDDENF